ncbi:MAG: S1C family serine protease [Myxococcaceae bacterium]
MTSGWVVLSLTLSAAPVVKTDLLQELERQQQELFERLAPSVVFIRDEDSFGSGFFIDSDGLILTNAHVVGKASELHVVLHDGRKVVGKVLERAPDRLDLALVKAEVSGVKAVPTASISELRVGNWVGAVGHGHGAAWTFNTGMVSNIYPVDSERPFFQTQIPLNPGNSGGPVFDRQGRVLGVVTAGITGANGINFAISLDVARRALPLIAKQCSCVVVNAPKGAPIFVDGKLVGTGPRVVLQTSEGKTHDVFSLVGSQRKRATVTYPAQKEVTF